MHTHTAYVLYAAQHPQVEQQNKNHKNKHTNTSHALEHVNASEHTQAQSVAIRVIASLACVKLVALHTALTLLLDQDLIEPGLQPVRSYVPGENLRCEMGAVRAQT